MKGNNLFRFVLGLIFLSSSSLLWAQYPTVYINKMFRGTGSGYTTSSNSITVDAQIVGENFRFIGSIAGSTFTGNGNNVDGSIVYTNATGSLITLANGKISSVGPSSGGIRKYFNFFISASEVYILVNPKYDADVPGSDSYQFNASSPITELNSFVTGQTTVTTEANLSGFTSCYGSASNAQTFTISGSNLSSNISVTAPTGFEVSLSSGSGYGSSVSLLKGSGTSIATTTVYVRMLAANAAGSYTGNLAISTTNSATKNVNAFGDVYTAPAITSQPSNATVCTGTAGTFSVVATGGNLTYQWQVYTGSGSWTNLSDAGIYYGSTTSVLRFSNAVDISYSTYQYRCVVSGACTPAVTSTAANLTVNAGVSIQTQPSNVAVCAGSSTSFSLAASGAGIVYQWQVFSSGSWVNVSNAGIYSGATTNTLSLSSTSSSENNLQYKCVLTGTCTTISTNVATLTVNDVPAAPNSISGDLTICENTNQSYSVTALSGATSYTWTLPTGWSGTSSLRAINVNATTTGGNITIKANNSCGSSSTTQVTITVSNIPAPIVDFGVNSTTQCLGSNSFSFTNATTTISGVTITSNTWNFADESSDIFTTNASHTYASANTFNVKLRVVASNGCIASKSSFVQVNPAPTTSISGTQTICSGSVAPLSVQFTGTQPWSITYSDGSASTSVTNITSSLYTLNVTPSTTKTFTIASITDANCSTNSAGDRTGSAVVTVNPTLTASVAVASNDADNSVCSGTSLIFTATPSNGGTPTYLWQKNGTDISGATISTYTVNSNSLLDDDQISVQMTSTATCLVQSVVFSNKISLHIAPAAPRTPNVISGATTQCALGVSKSYSIVDVLNATSYSWTVPTGWSIASGQGTIQALANVGAANQTGNISVSASNGCGTSTALDLIIAAVTASPSAPTGSASQSFCSAISPTVASLVATGASIKWYDSAGLINQLSSSFGLTTSTNYYATQTSGGCESSSLSVAVTVTTNPSISISGNATDYDLVSLTASGGSTYLWNAGSSPNLAANTFDESGTYSVSVTDNSGCTTIRSIVVQIKIIGLDRFGTSTEDNLVQVNRFGEQAGNNVILKTGELKKYLKYKMVGSNLGLHLNATNSLSYSGSGTTWSDLSTNLNHGSLQNGVAYSLNNGGQFVFDGTNDFVSLSNALPVTNEMTIDCWMNPSNISGTKGLLTQNGTSSGAFQLQLDGANVIFVFQGQLPKTANYTFKANQWAHLAMVFNQSTNNVKFYVNGTRVNTESYSSVGTIASAAIKIGSWEGTSRFFAGSIGSIRVYSSALIDNQINSNYQSSKDLYGL